MLKFLFAFIFMMIVGFSHLSFAQDEDTTKTQETTVTEDNWDNENWDNSDKDWDWDDNDWDFHNKDFEWMDFQFHGQPSMELSYGLPKMEIKSLNTGFNKPGTAEIRLGYNTLKEYDDYVIKYRNRFSFLGNFTKDLSNSVNDDTRLNANIWRFGLGWLEGYGYQVGKSAFIPYTSNSFVWTRVKMNYTDIKNLPIDDAYHGDLTPVISSSDAKYLDLFNDSFRFGTMTEAGIRVQIVPLFSVNAGYERAIIFPRHLFWKHLGSMAIEWAGLSAIDVFVHEVMSESPAAGPIINFILKNGLSYGLYQLRREKMNWPFDSAEPLTLDTWRFGATFTF